MSFLLGVDYTPLWNAAHRSDSGMVELFLSIEGCLHDKICPDGTTAFELAIGSRNINVASMLLNSPLMNFYIDQSSGLSQLIHTAVAVGKRDIFGSKRLESESLQLELLPSVLLKRDRFLQLFWSLLSEIPSSKK